MTAIFEFEIAVVLETGMEGERPFECQFIMRVRAPQCVVQFASITTAYGGGFGKGAPIHAPFEEEIIRARSFRLAPITISERISRSRETETSPDSTFATRD